MLTGVGRLLEYRNHHESEHVDKDNGPDPGSQHGTAMSAANDLVTDL
jgi:hypothetical protein